MSPGPGGSRPGYGGAGGPAKGRVLVIEDDRDIALGIRTVLTRNGFDVANSGDGKQGLRVVEDDPEAALFAVHVLSKRGNFEVTHTPDPAAALRLAAAGGFDLVVTDVDMPGMTGLELLDALRRIAPALPVAVLTGHADLRTDALLRHADEFLVKPVRVDQLLATATALAGRATGQ